MFGWKKRNNMKPINKAIELKSKFGSQSLQQVNYTIEVWTIKLNHAIKNKCDKSIRICNTTLVYWNKVKNIIKQQNN